MTGSQSRRWRDSLPFKGGEPTGRRRQQPVAAWRPRISAWWTATRRTLLREWSSLARLTVAAVVAFVFVQANDPGSTDLTGPLTALLVVQTSLVSTVRTGIGRIVAVLTGVLVAVAVTNWVGLSWWSLAAVVACALLLASIMRLDSNRLETPISAMLVLGVSQHDIAALTRVINTLIGAAVGVCLIVAFPPRVLTRDAATAVSDVAQAAAEATRRAAEEVVEALTRDRVHAWLEAVHAVLPRVGEAETAIAEAADSRRLNPRAVSLTDPIPVLRHGLGALDRSVVALRAMFLQLQEGAVEDDPGPDDVGYQDEIRGAFSVVLADMADCLSAFGSLIVAEAEGREVEAQDALATTLDTLRETRAILTELYLVVTQEGTGTWLVRGTILAAVERVLTELNVEQRARAKDQSQNEPPAMLTRLVLQRTPRSRLWRGWDLETSASFPTNAEKEP